MVSTEIVDIMKAAGLESPDISILSDEFLAEVRDTTHHSSPDRFLLPMEERAPAEGNSG
jgi:Domain of unknown function (DUF3387)